MLPNGKRIAHEWLALNPRRSDKSLGSFKVNMFTGAWADFATGDYGGDIISLFGFIADCNAVEAAKMVADFVGISPWQGGR